jgi:hypothetical protein
MLQNPGFYVPNIGSALPSPAPPGGYVPLSGADSYLPAPPGTYVPTAGASFPIPVPPGNTTNGIGATSYFPIPAITLVSYTLSPSGSTLSWNSVSGQNYGVFMSNNLSEWVEIATVPGTGSVVSKTVAEPAPGMEKRFFRVVAVPVP